MIHLHQVSKAFLGKLVIPSFELCVEAGQTIVLLGPSGCGKTTLLRMICGLTAPDQGDVFINQKKVKTFSKRELSAKLGYIIQEGGLFPHLNAKQNILLPAQIHRLSVNEVETRLSELLAMMEFDPVLLQQFPRQLSGGQRQRVALMRGLILNPDILLLDEPLSALDPLVRMGLQVQLRKIFRKLNKTVVIVTHDLNEAAYLADEIILIKDGTLWQRGKFRDLAQHPRDEFVKDFISAQIPIEVDDSLLSEQSVVGALNET